LSDEAAASEAAAFSRMTAPQAVMGQKSLTILPFMPILPSSFRKREVPCELLIIAFSRFGMLLRYFIVRHCYLPVADRACSHQGRACEKASLFLNFSAVIKTRYEVSRLSHETRYSVYCLFPGNLNMIVKITDNPNVN
jgi:hypothetical protein